ESHRSPVSSSVRLKSASGSGSGSSGPIKGCSSPPISRLPAQWRDVALAALDNREQSIGPQIKRGFFLASVGRAIIDAGHAAPGAADVIKAGFNPMRLNAEPASGFPVPH